MGPAGDMESHNSERLSGGSGRIAESVLKTAGPEAGAAASPPSTTTGVEGEKRDDSGQGSFDGNDSADESAPGISERNGTFDYTDRGWSESQARSQKPRLVGKPGEEG